MISSSRVAIASVAALAALTLSGCTASVTATRPTGTVHPAASSSAATLKADRTYSTCQLADMYYSMLWAATNDRAGAGSAGEVLYARDVGFAQLEENQLDFAVDHGTAVFDSDIAALRTAAQQSKAPTFTLPAGMEQPYIDAQDPRVLAALTKLRGDCTGAGQDWGIYDFGG